MTITFHPDADPLEVATIRADKAISLARQGCRERAMLEIVQGRARLRRTGLATCPTSQEVRRRLRAAEAVVDGLDVDADYAICDASGRKWKPVTEGDSITDGIVFVPEAPGEIRHAHRGAGRRASRRTRPRRSRLRLCRHRRCDALVPVRGLLPARIAAKSEHGG